MECQHKWCVVYSPSSYLKLKARCISCELVLDECSCCMSESIYTVDESGQFYILTCKECGKLKEIDDVVDEFYDR